MDDTMLSYKCEKHFIKMLKDVGMTMLKSIGTRCSICRQTSDDSMRNHEGKGMQQSYHA